MLRYIAYFMYYLVAKNLPRSYELGIIGRLSHGLRSYLCRFLFARAPRTIGVEKGADFGGGRNISMDEHANIGEKARIMGCGKVVIGKHAMMGPEVFIVTEDHKTKAAEYEGYVRGEVNIGDHAWIGARVILLKNAKIGKYAIIGAGSVVTGEIPDYAVAAGNPAKVIKIREINEN